MSYSSIYMKCPEEAEADLQGQEVVAGMGRAQTAMGMRSPIGKMKVL